MKWQKKEHEFEFYQKIFANKDTYIYGTGQCGSILFQLIGNKCAGIYDARYKEMEGAFSKLGGVKNPSEIGKLVKENTIMIVAMNEENAYPIVQRLISEGWIMGSNLFTYWDFMTYYFRFYSFYHDKCFYIEHFTINVSKHCTLNCRECSQRIPYQQNLLDGTLDEIIKSVDQLFQKVDFIAKLAITGGEPFLCKWLGALIDYLQNNYSAKIGAVRVVTNGTIIPDKDILDRIKLHKVTIECTKYDIPQSKLSNIKLLCEEKEIFFVENEHMYWFKMWTEQRHTKKEADWIFDNCICSSHCEGLIDGHITKCLCAYLASLSERKYGFQDVSVLLDDNLSREVLFEYIMGYTELGHLEPCEFCNGLYGINTEYVIPAEQII